MDVNFFDTATNDCPYEAYATLREEAPVWKDEATGMFFVTRYEDIREIVLDPKKFTNETGSAAGATEKAIAPEDPVKAKALLEAAEVEAELTKLYESKGWVVAPTLDGRDDPDHKQLRRMFDDAFRPAKIKLLDPFIEELSLRLIDEALVAGTCDWVSAFAVPLPLFTIGHLLGFPEEDMSEVKRWTDAFVQRMGLNQSPEERRRSAEQEIEAQRYFHERYEQLRAQPDESLLSDLVNNEVPGWDRPMNDNELHAELMADLCVGGSETTTNALSAGARLLAEQPDVWAKLKADPEELLDRFVEEVLRLESPVQGLLRTAAEDVELHGVKIPAGSVLMVRFGAANRDQRRFGCPADVDLERKNPRSHLAFSAGKHHCLGAALARRELHFGFKALIDRVDAIRLAPENEFSVAPNYFLRALKELNVELEPAVAVAS